MRYIFVILFLPFVAHAGMDQCVSLRGREQDLCFAVAKLDIRLCDRIPNLTERADCTRRVVEEQRKIMRKPREDPRR
jgi:hypothetical protein